MFSIRRLLGILFILLLSNVLWAQKQNDVWFFGKGLGMSFTSGTANVLPAPAHASSSYITSTACIADKNNGQLLFYTNGMNVYNRNHEVMFNGVLNANAYYYHLLIVPDPGDSLMYYLFCSNGNDLLYARINMRLNGGLGDVIQKNVLLQSGLDDRFTAVKQLYDGGYWLITHRSSDQAFLCFRINPDGIQSTPVVSPSPVSETWPRLQTFYSEIVTRSDGNEFAVMDNNSGTPNNKFILIYGFDKKCGTVVLKREIHSTPFIYDMAYDITGKFLYVISAVGGGDRNIIQYDMSVNKLYDTLGAATIIGNEPMRHIKLGPDNCLYITKEEMIENGYSPSRYLDVIRFPSAQGNGCGYLEKAYNLSPNNQCFNDPCYLTDRLPNYLMDLTQTQPSTFEPPKILVTGFCLSQKTHFEQQTASMYSDSSYWDFGDGQRSYNNIVDHIYTAQGTYYASFNWFLCGQQYQLKYAVKMGNIPRVFLGNDTTLCNGQTRVLSPDTVGQHYLWSTGDTTFAITIASPGTYSLQVSNGNCTASDAIQINYYPPLWLQLGDEYFICDRDKELVKLDAGEGFLQYKWTPTNDTTQWIIVGDLGNYFVVVKDFRGCDGADGTKVKRICPVELFFPNAFTPNGDGINETYLPIGNSVLEFEITIYNRWGEVVYHGNDVNKGWDGTTNGKPCLNDVYCYVAHYGGYINKHWQPFDAVGNFTLLR